MSFAPHLAYSVDKEPDLFGQGFNDPSNEFFDQFLTFDSIDNENSVYPALGDSTDLGKPQAVTSAGTSQATSRGIEGTRHHHQEPSSEAWDLDFMQNPSSPLLNPTACNILYHKTRRVSCDSDILSLEGISIHSPEETPQSPPLPSSPVLEASVRRRNRFVDTISKSLHIPKLRKANNNTTALDTQRSPIRKATLGSPTRKVTVAPPVPELHRLSPQRSPTRSPTRKITSPAKMMRGSHYSDQTIQHWHDRLQVDANKFEFGFQQHPPLSPPPSARVSDASEGSNMMVASDSQQSAFTWDQPVTQYATQRHDVHTPITSPTAGAHSFSQNPNMQSSHGAMMYQDPAQQSTAQWTQAQLEAEYNTFPSQYNQNDEGPPQWWAHASAAPLAQPSPTGYHRAPAQDPKTLTLQLQTELFQNAHELALSPSSNPQGLMIQLPHSPMHHQNFVLSTPPPHHQVPSYFPPPPQMQMPPQGTSRHRYTQSQPPPLPPSPTHLPYAPQMRKSRSRGDLSEPTSPGTRASSFHVQKRRSSSNRASSGSRNRIKSEHYASTPRTPKTPKSGAMFGDFVNFTPSDSSKILTGVAPSGSSKTKARREKEAMEKRRRLSQAALRAVQAAGGSIDTLVEEGLLANI